MKIKDILLKETKGYRGYQLMNIAISTLDMADVKDFGFSKLERVPAKLSRFVSRKLIKTAYKSNCCFDPVDEYYLVVAVDGTIFHLTY